MGYLFLNPDKIKPKKGGIEMAIDIVKFKNEGVVKSPHTRQNYHLYEKLKAKNAALSREEIGDLVGIPLKNGWQDSNGKKVWALLKTLMMDGKVTRRYINDTEYFGIVSGDIKPEDFGKPEVKPEVKPEPKPGVKPEQKPGILQRPPVKQN